MYHEAQKGLGETESQLGDIVNNSPVTIMGNVVADPEIRETAGGNTMATFSVASGHRYQKNGEWVEDTSFFNVVCWRFVARDVQGKLEKGSRVIVVGRLNHRSYETTDGDTRYVTEIIADRVGLDVGGIESAVRYKGRGGGGNSGPARTQEDEDAIW